MDLRNAGCFLCCRMIVELLSLLNVLLESMVTTMKPCAGKRHPDTHALTFSCVGYPLPQLPGDDHLHAFNHRALQDRIVNGLAEGFRAEDRAEVQHAALLPSSSGTVSVRATRFQAGAPS